ncbi:MAG: transcription antitermination factor NusB [Planctomycetaceae bacterium]|nr:methyltransferase domain-containing protein [Planctomycetaceae bacterium]
MHPSSPADSTRVPVTSRQWCFELLETYRLTQELLRDQLVRIRGENPSADVHQGLGWAERGILRQRTLDRVLKQAVSRPRENVQDPLWTLLRMGTAELLFGPEEGQHAAISETVELCRYRGSPEWAGFINGVLRGIQRMLANGAGDSPGRDCYPLTSGRYRRLNQDLFPDPEIHPTDYLAVAFSLPDALVREWARHHSTATLWQLAWSSLEAPALAVRLNRLAAEPGEWAERCASAGIAVVPTEFPEAFRLPRKIRLSEIPGFQEGEFVVQDLTAMHAARMLNPYPKQRVLDLCAGPGTKTTQLAELMLDQGEIIATDVTQARLDQIDENARRLGLTCIHSRWIERQNPEITGGPFDAILVDAPCSNTGVLGKRPEARWRYSIAELHSLNELQFRLLNVAAGLLAEEGRIVYSTCSIEPKENEQLLIRWLEQHPEFVCLEMKGVLPTPEHDGGFCARLEFRDLAEDEIEAP